jgi:hypothetical protein
MRIYVSKEFEQYQFSRFKNNYVRQRSVVDTMMRLARIPTHLTKYDVETWGENVQQFYNKEYGTGKFKIFVFNALSTKPIYESDAETYTHPILIYHNNNHFDGIKCISSFFQQKNYCLTCCLSYSNKSAHNMACESRCIKCSGTGLFKY